MCRWDITGKNNKMKKIILTSLFLAFLGVYAVNAQNKYQVTVSVQIKYVYYTDSNYLYEDHSSVQEGTPQVFDVCADTPEEAKDEAKSECSTVCSRNWGRELGRQVQNGQTYYVKEYREVWEASAKRVGSC